ncbi:MAG: heavy metal-binding domain-containing protein [Myxococcota bacterium]
MSLSTEVILSLGIPIGLIVLGRVAGKRIERKHYESIAERERAFAAKPAFSARDAMLVRPIADARLATGSVVVSVDHFKRFIAGFRMLVGGELGSYAPLIERARREAVLRMKESEPRADAYINTRLETSTISNASQNEGTGTIEVLAYATAVRFEPLQNGRLPGS